MVLRNIVELVENVPARMHFVDHALVDKTINDPVLRKAKVATALVFVVDRLNGQPASATFSILAEKLAAKLEPFLASARYRQYDFIITARGAGFLRDYTVEPRLSSSL